MSNLFGLGPLILIWLHFKRIKAYGYISMLSVILQRGTMFCDFSFAYLDNKALLKVFTLR